LEFLDLSPRVVSVSTNEAFETQLGSLNLEKLKSLVKLKSLKVLEENCCGICFEKEEPDSSKYNLPDNWKYIFTNGVQRLRLCRMLGFIPPKSQKRKTYSVADLTNAIEFYHKMMMQDGKEVALKKSLVRNGFQPYSPNSSSLKQSWMICSKEGCEKEYHFYCAGIYMKAPKGDWTCPSCLTEEAGTKKKKQREKYYPKASPFIRKRAWTKDGKIFLEHDLKLTEFILKVFREFFANVVLMMKTRKWKE